jgi:hypothetical protein
MTSFVDRLTRAGANLDRPFPRPGAQLDRH